MRYPQTELSVSGKRGAFRARLYCSGEISAFGSHQITLYSTGAGPADISIGPRQDPNSVWFIANATAPTYLIGRLDTLTHAVTTYPVTMTGGPNAIGAGPDGNMWITEARTGYVIGRFQTHAPFTFSEIPLPDDTYARAPTCGPDGNEWFTSVHFAQPDNPQGNPAIIGRVTLTKHDGLPGLTGLSDVIGNGLAGDQASRLGGTRFRRLPGLHTRHLMATQTPGVAVSGRGAGTRYLRHAARAGNTARFGSVRCLPLGGAGSIRDLRQSWGNDLQMAWCFWWSWWVARRSAAFPASQKEIA